MSDSGSQPQKPPGFLKRAWLRWKNRNAPEVLGPPLDAAPTLRDIVEELFAAESERIRDMARRSDSPAFRDKWHTVADEFNRFHGVVDELLGKDEAS